MNIEPAHATYVLKNSQESINIIINGEPMVLTKGDCIKFNRYVNEGENLFTIAKILSFGYSGGDYINRIFFQPWRQEGRWGSHTTPARAIGLEDPYLYAKAEWKSIKLVKCPDQAGGKCKNRKSTKQIRGIRKRQSRK